MNSEHYTTCENYDSTRTHVDYLSFTQYLYDQCYQGTFTDQTAILPVQHSSMWDIPGPLRQPSAQLPTSSYNPPAPPLLTESSYAHVCVTPMYICPALSQATGLLLTDRTIQTPVPRGLREGDRRLHDGPTERKLVPQETYKPPRQLKGLRDIQSIEFSVRGEKGIRLSDALEGIWAGFDGRDDRPSLGDNRLAIMLRLRFVGCPPWQSKISAVNYTTRRGPISRTRLASEVARSVKKFLEREKVLGHNDHSRCDWEDTPLSSMYLTRLVQVSTASWQPDIFVCYGVRTYPESVREA